MAISSDENTETPGPEAAFNDALARNEFLIQHCGDCDVHIFYPRIVCPDCGSTNLTGVAASGGGTVYATSVVRQRPEAGDDYNIALIDLDEGPRLMSRVVDVPAADVRIGDAVSAFVGDIDGNAVVLFRPSNNGPSGGGDT